MFLNLFAIDWAKHVVAWLAKELAPKANQTCYNHISMRSTKNILYGTSSANFSLSSFNTGTGAYAFTAQTMDQAYVLDDRGIMSLGTTLNFGNFLPAALTMNIPAYIAQHRELAVGSTVNRDKGQYRVFFSDGTGLYMTNLNGKVLGSMPVEYA